jgi:hypothetical protein
MVRRIERANDNRARPALDAATIHQRILPILDHAERRDLPLRRAHQGPHVLPELRGENAALHSRPALPGARRKPGAGLMGIGQVGCWIVLMLAAAVIAAGIIIYYGAMR